MPLLHRRIIIEIEAVVPAVNNHDQDGDLERRFMEEQLVQPVKDALQAFHRAKLGDLTFRPRDENALIFSQSTSTNKTHV